jgi:hypothetical protein
MQVFDKVSVLYEGRQIYFGSIHTAKEFFVNLGFECPERQTTADFLTSLTSPSERTVRPGFENSTPRTPDEFAAVWKKSEDHARLMREIEEYENEYPVGGEQLKKFQDARRAMTARGQYVSSSYVFCCGLVNEVQAHEVTIHHLNSHAGQALPRPCISEATWRYDAPLYWLDLKWNHGSRYRECFLQFTKQHSQSL